MKKELKKLTNGCTRTSVFVSPKNYKDLNSKSEFPTNWFVQCRFFDPEFIDKYPDGFQYRKKFTGDDLQQLKLVAKIYSNEMEIRLDDKHFNPISKLYMAERKGSLHPYLPFIEALKKAHEKLSPAWTSEHAYEVLRCVNKVDKLKTALHFSELLISDIRTWHIKTILDELNCTDAVFNKSRSYLQSLFRELTQYGCCEVNPVDNITKRSEVQNIREVILIEDLELVYKYLQYKHYSFFRYGKIFFYSGGRTTEFFRVQKKHVDIENQEYKIFIKKGKRKTWVKKIIIPAAIPYWREILNLCKNDDDYLFCKGLVPGSIPISPKQISRRWKKYVKDSDEIKNEKDEIVKITADFYTLKHLFLDILDEMHSVPIIPLPKPAQRMGGHTTESTTDIYTTGKINRKNEDLKRLKIG